MNIKFLMQETNLLIWILPNQRRIGLVLDSNYSNFGIETDLELEQENYYYEIEDISRIHLIIESGKVDLIDQFPDSKIIELEYDPLTKLYIDMLSNCYIELTMQDHREINPTYENEELQIFIEEN